MHLNIRKWYVIMKKQWEATTGQLTKHHHKSNSLNDFSEDV